MVSATGSHIAADTRVTQTSRAPLQDKVIAVTGASGGIGRALAANLADAGAQLVLGAGLGEEARLAEFDRSATVLGVDVTDEPSVARFIAAVTEVADHLDGIVTLAGVMEQVPVDKLTDEIWHKVLTVNLTGTFRIVRQALPLLRRSVSASVVTMSSQLAYTGAANAVAYSASKAGVLGLTRALARDLGPRIRVNSVAPGPVSTDMTSAHLDEPGWVETKTSRQVMRRFADPSEIAGPIRFLLSDESSFMTGQTLSPNGGGAMP